MDVVLSKGEVASFLSQMKGILKADTFNIDSHFRLIKNSKEEIEYSTPYTLIDLEYDVFDVVNELKSLEVSNYSESKLDRDDPNPPILLVFGKVINNREIYIKIKCRDINDIGQVICVSFHYAKWEMKYPYK